MAPGYTPLPAPQQNPFATPQQAQQMITLPNGQQLTLQQFYQLQAAQQGQQQNPLAGLLGGGAGGSGGSSLFGSSAPTNSLSTSGTQLASYNNPANYLPTVTTPPPEPIASMASGGTGAADGLGVSSLPTAETGALAADGTLATVGIPAAVIAATALGGKSIYDGLKGKKDNSIPGVAGRVTAGIATGGLSEAARALFGHQSTKDYQKEQNTKLGNKIPSFKAFIDQANANRANMPESKFNQTHNIADLGVNDITGANPFFEKYGNDWLGTMSEKQRNDIAQQALTNGAVGSHKGLITVDWNKFDQNKPPLAPTIQATTKPAMIPKMVKY